MEARSLDAVRKEMEDARNTLTKYSSFSDDLAKTSSDDDGLKSFATMLECQNGDDAVNLLWSDVQQSRQRSHQKS